MTFAAPNTACLVCWPVLDGKNPITFISYDEEDVCGNFCVQKITARRLHVSFP